MPSSIVTTATAPSTRVSILICVSAPQRLMGHVSAAKLHRRREEISRGIIKSPHWLIAILFAFIFLDAMIYTYVGRALLRNVVTPPLEFKNPYVGLDEMYNNGVVNSSYHAPIVNRPRRVAHVFRTDSHLASPVDEHRKLTSYGTISPPEEHLHVSSDVSTSAVSIA